MDELAHADGGRIAVAADTECDQTAICQNRTGCHRGHASMHGVEAVRTVHEICRAFGGTSDTAHLDDALRLNTHFVHGINDAFGDCVVPAAGTKRGLAALVLHDGQADAVGLW